MIGAATTALTINVLTKATLNAVNFDTDNEFDNATNYRFTATDAGRYLVVWRCNYDSMNDASKGVVQIKLNGGNVFGGREVYAKCSSGAQDDQGTTNTHILNISASDYLEGWAKISVSGRNMSTQSYFSVHRLG